MSAYDDNTSISLRRSSRSTRGSIKPIIDLRKSKEVQEEADELDLSDGQEPVHDNDKKDSKEDVDYQEPKERRTALSKSSKGSTRKSKVNSVAEESSTKQTVKSSTKAPKKKSNKTETEDLSDFDDVDVETYTLSEKEMKEINNAFDLNCSSAGEELMTSDDLKTAIRSLGFEPRAEEIQKLINKYGNKAKKMSRDSFHRIMAYKIGSSPGAHVTQTNDAISRVFNLLDLDKTGAITLENLKSISKELNEDITEQELQEMMTEADQDGDFQINKEEFHDIMKKTGLY